MKKLLILLIVFISCYGCVAQPRVGRAGPSNTVMDYRVLDSLNLVVPKYLDTTRANLTTPNNIGLDSCGAIIQTRSPRAFWRRECYPSKHWVRFIDVENFSDYIDTAQQGSITNISIINQVDSSISIEFCNGIDNCDTITYNTTITNATSVSFVTDSSIAICSVDTVSGGHVQICDTIITGKKGVTYFYQNDLTLLSTNIVEHGGILLHNTTTNTDPYKYTITGGTIYDYPFNVSQIQGFGNSTSVASFLHASAGSNKFGINYTGNNYPGLGTGYFGNTIQGYLLSTNITGNGSYGMGIGDQNAKIGGILIHTKDTTLTDAVTIFGSRPPLVSQAWNMQPNTMDSTRIAVFKHDKQVQFKGYGAGTRITVPNTIAGWDANGNFVEVDTTNMGGSITFIDSTKIIICSFGDYLCDTIFTTQGGRIGLYAANGLSKRNDSTLVLGGTLDQTTTIEGASQDFNLQNVDQLYISSRIYDLENITDATHYTLVHSQTSATAANNYWQVDAKGGVNGSYFGVSPTAIYTSGRFQLDIGASVAAANDLTLGTDGNLFSITGNTQINAIATTNWQAGSQVSFIFTGTPTLKNNTAGGAGTATMLLAGRVDYTAAAGDYIAFVYDGTNWYETQRQLVATASGVNIYNSNGTLTGTRTVSMGGFATTWSGTVAGFGLTVNNSGSGGINAFSAGSNAALAGSNTSTGPALTIQSVSGSIINAIKNAASTNTYELMANFDRNTTGTAANNIGGQINLNAESSDGSSSHTNTELKWSWPVATTASRESKFTITGVMNAVTADVLTLNGNGSIQLRPITATAASAITPVNGMMLYVSDTDATFLTVGFWGYQGGTWVKM